MIVKKDIKKYIGAVESEEKAAKYYDKYALIIQGFDVRHFIIFIFAMNSYRIGKDKLLLYQVVDRGTDSLY